MWTCFWVMATERCGPLCPMRRGPAPNSVVIAGGAPLLALFEKGPAGPPAVWGLAADAAEDRVFLWSTSHLFTPTGPASPRKWRGSYSNATVPGTPPDRAVQDCGACSGVSRYVCVR